MLILTLFVLVAVLTICLIFRGKVNELELRLQAVTESKPSYREFENLIARVHVLERAGAGSAKKPDSEAPPAPAAMPVASPVAAFPAPPPAFIPDPAPPSPRDSQPSLLDRIRARFDRDEWEELVGGSVLNKIGAVVLVIGIALFLVYSYAHIGRGGRAALSIAFSTAMLLAGVWSEKQPRLRVFSRGLIGAGWAALYASAYAIWAVPEARIIANPFLGSVILLAVACGMIGHSLRYRLQTVTGVAYFAAFAALAITPATPFAVVSLVPLAASVLYLALKFDWFTMALFGAVGTYLTCVSKGDPHADLTGTQTLLLVYWLLFETFDLLRVRRGATAGGVEWLFPVNAGGFLGVSFLAWSSHSPTRLWLASACAAALFLASAAARAWVCPASSRENEASLLTRLRAGGFEGATLISAVLAGLSIFGRVPGIWSSFGLALEAEGIYLAGVAFGSRFLRGFGARCFAVSLVRLGYGMDPAARTMVLQHRFWDGSPALLAHAAFFTINRAVRSRGAIFSSLAAALVACVLALEANPAWAGAACALFGALLLQLGWWKGLFEFRAQGYVLSAGGFAWSAGFALWGAGGPWMPLAVCLAMAYLVAAQTRWAPLRGQRVDESRLVALGSAAASVILAALLLWRVVPGNYLGVAWYLLTLAVLELGLRGMPAELRWFWMPLTLVSLGGILATHSTALTHHPAADTWLTYLVACLANALFAARLSRVGRGLEMEEFMARDVASVLGTASAAVFIWLVAPIPLISLAWVALAMLLAMPLPGRIQSLQRPLFTWLSVAVGTLALGRVLFVDLQDGAMAWHVANRALTVPVLLGAVYWLSSRYRALNFEPLSRAAIWSALAPLTGLILAEAGRSNAPCFLAAASVVLLAWGTLRGGRDFRLQSYLLAALAVGGTVLFSLSPLRLEISLPVAGLLYAARFVARRDYEPKAPALFSLAATLLLSAVLFRWVSGGVLTVTWGLQGAVLLVAGFPLRDRVFRLQGLALLLACTLKLFLYDLRNLETPYRIVSFIALGFILLGVSWAYSRFRERIEKIL